ncbi:putative proteasome activator complex subunit 4 [Helianthus debilis subsp. tardiflorus]
MEPPVNFIVPAQSIGKKRPRWALTDKAYMHNTWITSQSSYHLYRTSKIVCPSDNVNLAGRSLVKMIKRWPSLIAKCVLTLTENLRTPSSPEYLAWFFHVVDLILIVSWL